MKDRIEEIADGIDAYLAQKTDQEHYQSCHYDSEHNGDGTLLLIEIEHGRRKRSGPSAGTGDRDAYEKHQRDKRTIVVGTFCKLLACLLTLIEHPFEELASML